MCVCGSQASSRSLCVVGTVGGTLECRSADWHGSFSVLESPNVLGRVHSGAVRRIVLVPGLGLLSAGMDGRMVLTDPARFATNTTRGYTGLI